MRNALMILVIMAVGFAGIRLVADGEHGEIITAITLVAACILFVGWALLGAIERRDKR